MGGKGLKGKLKMVLHYHMYGLDMLISTITQLHRFSMYQMVKLQTP